MAQDKPPLSDLSFFRFPEVTGEVVRNILLLLLALVLTVLVTVFMHSRVQHWLRMRSRRRHFDRFSDEHRMDPAARAVLKRLMAEARRTDEFAFVQDAPAFEAAVERFAAQADEAGLAALSHLRRTLHLNVMNPDVELVSTRQLLQDLPVRIMATIGEEKLDLYCALLGVDERYLLIDLPHEEEIARLLGEHPHAFLLFWREREGEALFRIELEPVGEGAFVAFRAAHAMRDPETEHRSAFRLSVDLPATYQFMDRSELGRLRTRAPGRQTQRGEGRVVDLGYGGASLVVPEPLAERGLAQLAFDLHGFPMRLMLEVLSTAPMSEGRFLVRGQFRGLGEEAHVKLNNVLYREQIKRLRDKQLLHFRPGG